MHCPWFLSQQKQKEEFYCFSLERAGNLSSIIAVLRLMQRLTDSISKDKKLSYLILFLHLFISSLFDVLLFSPSHKHQILV